MSIPPPPLVEDVTFCEEEVGMLYEFLDKLMCCGKVDVSKMGTDEIDALCDIKAKLVAKRRKVNCNE